jgi:drug/metabolite transporter (DMT)-like permease
MTDRRSQLDTLSIASLLLCCVLWGLNQVAAKVALAEIPPLLQAAARSLGAALLVALWARWRRVPLFARDGTAAGGFWAGLLFAGEFACIFIGLQFTTASRMVVFIYLAPFIVALGMHFIAHVERLRPDQWLGLAVAFAGVAAAFADGFTHAAVGPLQWLGDALGLAAALLWAGTTLVIRGTRLTSAPAEKTLLYQLVISGLLLGAVGLAQGEHWPAALSARAAAAFAFQLVIVTFASYLLWFWLVRHYPATRLSAFTLLTPIFGLLAGVGLLHEPVTPRLALGLAAVVFGIAVVNRPRRARA